MPPRPIVVVAGLGNAVGTGAASAELFAAQLGYRVALVSRPRKDVDDLRDKIAKNGGDAQVFAVQEYGYEEIKDSFRRIEAKWPESRIKCCILNFSQWSMKPFMEIDRALIEASARINIVTSTAFCQEAVAAFTSKRSGDGPLGADDGPGGTLIVTGATSATRGAHSFGAFAAGKSGLRAMTQSIAREYGPQGVHVSFVVVDGTILTKRTAIMFGSQESRGGAGWMADEMQRLSPESIAKCYAYLHSQSPDCWTLEMDLRPAKEKF